MMNTAQPEGRARFAGRRIASLTKYAGNPILAPGGADWRTHALYNPTAWTDDETVFLLYRAEGPSDIPGRPFTSRIGLATSRDGIHFEHHPAPILSPGEPYELPGGCEDPRLVQIDGTFYLTYTAYDGAVARLCLASSPDLLHWHKHGPMFADEQWDAYFPRQQFPNTPRAWSKSGAIVPIKIGGRYWMYFGDTHIWAASSPDLRAWQIDPAPVVSPRANAFDAGLVEPGPAPLVVNDTIWLGYNSADTRLRYAFGQVLLDLEQPTRTLYRSETPLLQPESRDEIEGQVPQVVFVEGMVFFQGRWLLYYGMADSRLGLAVAEWTNEF